MGAVAHPWRRALLSLRVGRVASLSGWTPISGAAGVGGAGACALTGGCVLQIYEVVRPLVSLLHLNCSGLQNFEALMALTNLAGISERLR